MRRGRFGRACAPRDRRGGRGPTSRRPRPSSCAWPRRRRAARFRPARQAVVCCERAGRRSAGRYAPKRRLAKHRRTSTSPKRRRRWTSSRTPRSSAASRRLSDVSRRSPLLLFTRASVASFLARLRHSSLVATALPRLRHSSLVASRCHRAPPARDHRLAPRSAPALVARQHCVVLRHHRSPPRQ